MLFRSYFAFDSYQLDAVDYLLKPISFPRFLKAIEKANSFLEAKTKNRESIKSISFRVNSSVQEYLFDNIIYFQSIGNYIKVYLKNPTRSIVIYDSLKSLMEHLPHHQFVQTHKSYIVNIDFIQSIGKEQLLLSNASPIPIGRKYELMVNSVLKK